MTDMMYMFSGASSFNGDLSGWNTSSVKYMNGMFNNAASGSEAGQEAAAGEGIFAQLSGLMNPKSVAVVGASNRSDGWSGMALSTRGDCRRPKV